MNQVYSVIKIILMFILQANFIPFAFHHLSSVVSVQMILTLAGAFAFHLVWRMVNTLHSERVWRQKLSKTNLDPFQHSSAPVCHWERDVAPWYDGSSDRSFMVDPLSYFPTELYNVPLRRPIASRANALITELHLAPI